MPASRAEGARRLLPAIALVGALAAVLLPLAAPETVAGHSAMSDRVRAVAFQAAVAGGDRLPAWLPDLYDRHGSPLPSFYAPMSYLLVEALRALGGSVELAFKVAYALLWLGGACGAAYAARTRFGAGAGVPAAAAFALAPYTLADVYVRAGIAEFAALALLPWILMALARPGPLARLGGALAVAALALTHNVTSLMALPALAVLVACGNHQRRRHGFWVLAGGLGMSLFFWLPAWVETRWLWSERSLTSGFFDYERHFLAPLDLLPWRTSLNFTIGPESRLPFRFGELLLAATLGALALARRRDDGARRDAALLAIATLAALLLTTSLAAPIWRALPLVAYVQFPFRFFLLATAFAAPLVGYVVARVPARPRPLAGAIAVVLALLVAQPWAQARYFLVESGSGRVLPFLAGEVERARADGRFVPVESHVTLTRLRTAHWSGTAGDEFLPRTVTRLPDAPGGEPESAATAVGEGVIVAASSWGYPEVRAEVAVEAPGVVVLHQFWFPGWNVEVDGVPRAATAEPERGRIVVAVRPGDREIRARFGPTPLRRAARLGSLLCALALAGGLLASRRPPAPTA